MQITEVTLEEQTLSAYFKLIENITKNKEHFFRGQSNAKWSLTPKLYRNPPSIKKKSKGDDDSRYTRCEDGMLESFFSRGMPYLENAKRGFIADRILAQHYGVPTRLLDWSFDPLVALYFAVQNTWAEDQQIRKNNSQIKTDAAVFCINQMQPLSSEYYYDIDDAKKIEILEILNTDKIKAIFPPTADQRISVQKSIFTLQKWEAKEEGKYIPIDQRDNLTSETHREIKLKKIIIPAGMKIELLRKLFNYGVNKPFLFPGLESIGENLTFLAEITAENE